MNSSVSAMEVIACLSSMCPPFHLERRFDLLIDYILFLKPRSKTLAFNSVACHLASGHPYEEAVTSYG
jgi:hypothetical protein